LILHSIGNRVKEEHRLKNKILLYFFSSFFDNKSVIKIVVSNVLAPTCCFLHVFLLSLMTTVVLLKTRKKRGISVARASGTLSMIAVLLMLTDII
jgi:hypothetical protein